MLLLLHLVGALLVFALCGFELFRAMHQMPQPFAAMRLLYVTLFQTVTGFLLAMTSVNHNTLAYCSRGIVYFTVIGFTLWIIYRRQTEERITSAQIGIYLLANATYFAPLLWV